MLEKVLAALESKDLTTLNSLYSSLRREIFESSSFAKGEKIEEERFLFRSHSAEWCIPQALSGGFCSTQVRMIIMALEF